MLKHLYQNNQEPNEVKDFNKRMPNSNKYPFFFINRILLDCHENELLPRLEVISRNTFNSNLESFEYFVISCIDYFKLEQSNKFGVHKKTLIYEWFKLKRGSQSLVFKENGITKTKKPRIICLGDPGCLKSLFKDLNTELYPNEDKPPFEIKGYINDFIFSNFEFSKGNPKITNTYQVKWNGSRNLLIALMWYLNDKRYFKEHQKEIIIKFLCREFGLKGFSNSNINRVWDRKEFRSNSLEKLQILLMRDLKYYL